MKKIPLAGVVVFYNPSLDNISNIDNYINMLDKLYIIDNTEKDIKIKFKSNKIVYKKNKCNMGIAYALNLGAKLAIADGFDWLLTLDQDSKINSDIISKMICFLKNNKIKNLGIISPYHNIVTFEKKPEIKTEEKMEVMTSGNIINLNAYKKVNGFKNELFIDCVDIEYGMNLNKNNYKVLRLNYIEMPHTLGDSKIIRFLGRDVITSNHNALRRYYMTRNTLYVNKLYKNIYPDYCKMLIRSQLGQLKRVIFLEKDKINKLKMIIRGIIDYKKGITGKFGGNDYV